MGAGYHGGFGATKGSAKLLSKEYCRGTQQIKDKEQLYKGIDGITPQASEIVKNVKLGRIKLTILGDELFEEYLGVGSGTLGVAIGNKIYLRMSSSNALSDFVHEGTHAIDHLSGILKNISLVEKEMRAYKQEHIFQKAKGIPLDFKNTDDIKVHVILNYKKGGNKR